MKDTIIQNRLRQADYDKAKLELQAAATQDDWDTVEYLAQSLRVMQTAMAVGELSESKGKAG